MMKAIAPLLALVIFAIAPSPALADPGRLHHDYYKLINAGSTAATASNSFPWATIAVGFAIAAVAALLLMALHRTRRTGAYGH